MSRFGPEKVPGFVHNFFRELFCQMMTELFELLWLIANIRVAAGTCMACARSGIVTNRTFHVTE